MADETNVNCIANGNGNEKGETNGHNDDIDLTNLLHATDLKIKHNFLSHVWRFFFLK